MIKQTNRTILFDVINPEVFNLSNLMTGTEENVSSLTDEKIKEINDALLVGSFNEFLEKFKPTIYSYFDANNMPQHSLVKPTGVPDMFVKETVLDKSNRILKMFTSMMDRKNSSSTANVDFDYEAITKLLAPDKALKEMQKIKMEIRYLEGQNSSLEKDSPAKADAVKKLLGKYNATKKYYNETGAQLALTAGMLKENLIAMEKASQSGKEYALPALPVFEDGELKTIAPSADFLALSAGAASSAAKAALTDGGDSDVKLLEDGSSVSMNIDYSGRTVTALTTHYNESMTQIYSSVGETYDPEKGSFHLELVLSAFTDNSSIALMQMPKEEKVEKYNRFTALHALWEKSFIREAKMLIEKLLNVKAFFDQYTAKLPKMKPKLLVVNSRVGDIVEESYLKQLQQYLESVNNKMECADTIWFGIVPDIKFNDDEEEAEVELKQMREMGFTGDFDTGTRIEPNQMMDFQTLMKAIRKYRIQTFFSFEACEGTTFSTISTHGIDKYIDKTECLNSTDYDKFAIACLPNFTIIPQDRSKVVYGTKANVTETGVSFSKDIEDQFKFWIYGVYVSSAFVAAGLMAACQCSNYLSSRFGTSRKVNPDLPGVRFDIEADNHSETVTTTFAKEIKGFTNDERQKLNEKNFGFVFSSDRTGDITIFKARSMYENAGSYVSLFKETTTSYILRMLRILSNDKRAGIEKQFEPGGQVKKWELAKGYVNSILGEADSIGMPATDDGITRIEVIFGGAAEYIRLIDIVAE